MTQFAVCCAHLLPLKKEIGVELLPPLGLLIFILGHLM